MKHIVSRLLLSIGGLLLSSQLLLAQTGPDLRDYFDADLSKDQIGTVLHYQLTHNTIFQPATTPTDFYIYVVDGQRIETVYAEEHLGTGKAVWHDIWLIDDSGYQFSRRIRKNLQPIAGQPDYLQDSLYDYGAKLLRTQYVHVVDGQEKILSDLELLSWGPTLWHRDLGIWFLTFMPRLKADSKPITVLMDSWAHLLLLTTGQGVNEQIDSREYRRYTFQGRGLLSMILHNVKVWLSTGPQARVEKMELNVHLSWTWPRLQFTLNQQQSISQAEWMAKLEKLRVQSN
jgi:hypothetical protein